MRLVEDVGLEIQLSNTGLHTGKAAQLLALVRDLRVQGGHPCLNAADRRIHGTSQRRVTLTNALVDAAHLRVALAKSQGPGREFAATLVQHEQAPDLKV